MARGKCIRKKTVKVKGYSHKVCVEYAGGKPRRSKKAKKAYCVPGTVDMYKGKCACRTRGGGFRFLPKGRCSR